MDGVIKSENKDFEQVLGLIKQAQQDVARQVNAVVIDLYWKIGEYLSQKAASAGWGKSVVEELSAYILNREPGAKGYSTWNLWRMKRFYETYYR